MRLPPYCINASRDSHGYVLSSYSWKGRPISNRLGKPEQYPICYYPGSILALCGITPTKEIIDDVNNNINGFMFIPTKYACKAKTPYLAPKTVIVPEIKLVEGLPDNSAIDTVYLESQSIMYVNIQTYIFAPVDNDHDHGYEISLVGGMLVNEFQQNPHPYPFDHGDYEKRTYDRRITACVINQPPEIDPSSGAYYCLPGFDSIIGPSGHVELCQAAGAAHRPYVNEGDAGCTPPEDSSACIIGSCDEGSPTFENLQEWHTSVTHKDDVSDWQTPLMTDANGPLALQFLGGKLLVFTSAYLQQLQVICYAVDGGDPTLDSYPMQVPKTGILEPLGIAWGPFEDSLYPALQSLSVSFDTIGIVWIYNDFPEVAKENPGQTTRHHSDYFTVPSDIYGTSDSNHDLAPFAREVRDNQIRNALTKVGVSNVTVSYKEVHTFNYDPTNTTIYTDNGKDPQTDKTAYTSLINEGIVAFFG